MNCDLQLTLLSQLQFAETQTMEINIKGFEKKERKKNRK